VIILEKCLISKHDSLEW